MANPIKTGKDLFYMEMRLKQAVSVAQAKAWSVSFWKVTMQHQHPGHWLRSREAAVSER